MKKILIFLVCLGVIGAAGYFGLKFYRQYKLKKEPFLWGVTMRPHALGRYDANTWNKELNLAKDLGVKYIRIGWQYDAWYNGKLNPFGFHDKVFSQAKEKGLSIYLVIESNPAEISELKNPYMEGYNSAFQIASHYKGQIKYYQLLNEAGSTAIKGSDFSGEKEEDYDAAKYVKVRDWLKGASEGIRKADSSAYRVITDQWLHYAFFDMLAKDKVDFDILGWDWFSDMGLMSEKKLADGTLILDKLKSFGKPIILAEVNGRPDGDNGQKGQDEAKQAEFIQKMADWAYNSKVIKGFIVLELMDVTNTGRGYVDYYGLVNATEKKNGVGTIGEPKKAYQVYKEIIKKYQ